MRLEGKVAIITGGGSGIGRATAALFGREGARIVVTDLNEEHARETVRQVEDTGAEAIAVGGDVTRSSDAQHMVTSAVQSYGRLDVLVNSAGVSARNALPADASPEALWDRVIEVNLKGTYLVTWYAVPEMTKSNGGSVINLASIMGLVGYPVEITGGFNPYPPSKGGVVQFTRNMAIGFAKDNIRVNCVCPGFIWTSLTESLTSIPETVEFLEGKHPLGRLGQPEDVANAALFLASDESSYVTGASLVVDGGYTAQ